MNEYFQTEIYRTEEVRDVDKQMAALDQFLNGSGQFLAINTARRRRFFRLLKSFQVKKVTIDENVIGTAGSNPYRVTEPVDEKLYLQTLDALERLSRKMAESITLGERHNAYGISFLIFSLSKLWLMECFSQTSRFFPNPL